MRLPARWMPCGERVPRPTRWRCPRGRLRALGGGPVGDHAAAGQPLQPPALTQLGVVRGADQAHLVDVGPAARHPLRLVVALAVPGLAPAARPGAAPVALGQRLPHLGRRRPVPAAHVQGINPVEENLPDRDRDRDRAPGTKRRSRGRAAGRHETRSTCGPLVAGRGSGCLQKPDTHASPVAAGASGR